MTVDPACLAYPLSIDDARHIIECVAGPDWREPFMRGLGRAVYIGLVLTLVVALAVHAWRSSRP